jgi:PAS domain S-box-containing protein
MDSPILSEMRLDPRYGDLIFDHIPHGIFTVDETGRITSFNRAAEEITGWTRGDAVGTPCREVFRSNRCHVACFLRHSVEAGEPHRDREVRITRKDGSELLVAVSTAALRDARGTVIGGVEMLRDLSDVDTLRREITGSYTCEDIVGSSAAMRGVRDLLPLVAKSDSTVLIEGEPGTGKELVARAIHTLGPRREGPFVAIDCGTLSETLVVSELFGHEPGASADRETDRSARSAQAQGGTLLLNGVGELSARLQIELLRVLQEREITPSGSGWPVKLDARILAATKRDLALDVTTGRFNQDLYFHLNIVRIALAPLRSRTGDIPLLVDRLIQRINALRGRRITGISDRAMACLMAYRFPDNVRELEDAVAHASAICTDATIKLDDLPPHVRGHDTAPSVAPPPSARRGPLKSAEAAVIQSALARHNGNRTRAAKDLGISRNTLWRKMKRNGIR